MDRTLRETIEAASSRLTSSFESGGTLNLAGGFLLAFFCCDTDSGASLAIVFCAALAFGRVR